MEQMVLPLSLSNRIYVLCKVPVTLVEKNTAKILEFVVFLSYHMTIPIDDNVPFAALKVLSSEF
jgi:hypothetical protein